MEASYQSYEDAFTARETAQALRQFVKAVEKYIRVDPDAAQLGLEFYWKDGDLHIRRRRPEEERRSN